MKTNRTLSMVTVLFALGLFFTASDATAQNVGKAKQGVAGQYQTPGKNFVDADGDGICDFDVNKDGIPNHNDPNFVRPQDGSGRKLGSKNANGKGLSGKQGIGPRDGSGAGSNGAGSGSGVCDGTGPKGTQSQRGRK